MQTPNLAIVFGPTLMWPPAHLVSVNLALDMMQQNIIVEALLNNVHNIFPWKTKQKKIYNIVIEFYRSLVFFCQTLLLINQLEAF